MNSKEEKLLSLRERAELALRNGEIALAKLEKTQIFNDTQKLIEKFRVYQVELELQNEELTRTQFAAEQALERYRTLFTSLPLAGVILDRYGIIIDANAQATDLFGFKAKSKLLKHSFYRLIDEEDRGRVLDVLHLDDNGVTSVLNNMKVLTNNGKFTIMDGHLIHLPLDYHLDNYTILLLVDRSVESILESNRVLYQSMLDNSPSIMTAFDEDGHCLLANAAMLKFINRSPEQVLGRKREFWQNLEDAQKNNEKDSAVMSTGNAALEEEILSNENNDKNYYLCNRFPLRNKEGDIFAVGVVKTDITAIREIEVRLQLATQIFSQGSEGIIITDENNRIISTNKAFEHITGYKEADVLGKNPSILSSGKQSHIFYKEMWRTLSSKNQWEGEIYNRRKSGEIYPQHLSISRVLDDRENLTYYIAIFNDITHKKQIEQEIHQLAFYDPLTNTPNRHLLRDRLTQAVGNAIRENSRFCLMFLDLDHFKEVNDTLGHAAGDQLLIEVSRRLESQVRDKDTVCRFGGDEFVLLLSEINRDDATIKANAILTEILKPYVIQNQILTISTSLGIAIYPEDGSNYSELLKNADTAMYQAKENGRNSFRFFRQEMQDSSVKRMAIEFGLRNAIEKEEFWLAYQPQICLITKKLVGVEVLLRWKNLEMDNPMPDEFIPIAEANGLIVPIGEWVLKESLKQLRKWIDEGHEPFTVAVNISARQFWNDDFTQMVRDALYQSSIPAYFLELELTERLVMHEPEAVIEIMNDLKLLGVKISIDDFGTGYSSLNYLKRLPVDKLKIDQSFVRDIKLNDDDEIIVLSIVQLAKALRKETIAEGVETLEQEAFLLNIGCNTSQGFLRGRPMAIEMFNSWLFHQSFINN
jgi:diguanylate cyclase (GGDEF)-like protein/PAS domain S-box-containing protein